MKFYLCGALTALFLVSCGQQEEVGHTAPDTGDLLERFFTSEVPGDAKQIHEVRAGLSVGDEITVQGMVMGRMRPIVDERAALVLGDRTILTPCNEKDDDECETPWDVCCDSSEDKRRGTATIQIVDDDGRVVAGSLRGIQGLAELSTLTVHGVVAEGSDADVLIVNAGKIHVHP
jgi:hypothetical protein